MLLLDDDLIRHEIVMAGDGQVEDLFLAIGQDRVDLVQIDITLSQGSDGFRCDGLSKTCSSRSTHILLVQSRAAIGIA